MYKRLLQKSRNRFLQQENCENLIPNKRLNYKIKGKPRPSLKNISYYSNKQNVFNQWVFSWSELKKRTRENLVLLAGVEDKITKTQQQRALLPKKENVCGNVEFNNQLIPLCAVLYYKEKRDLPFYKNVEPSNCLLLMKLNLVLGGNILYFFNTKVVYTQFHGTLQKLGKLFHLWPLLHNTNEMPPVSQVFFSNLLKSKQNNELNKNNSLVIYTFKWGENFHNVADFMQQQLEHKSWNKITNLNKVNKSAQEKIKKIRAQQYMECRKISILYGNLPRRALVRIMRKIEQGGDLCTKFISILEKRLDVVLKRIFFFPTISMARQWIHQGKIWVNNQPCTVQSYLLQPADFIAVNKAFRLIWKKNQHYFFNDVGLAKQKNLDNSLNLGKKINFSSNPSASQALTPSGVWGNASHAPGIKGKSAYPRGVKLKPSQLAKRNKYHVYNKKNNIQDAFHSFTTKDFNNLLVARETTKGIKNNATKKTPTLPLYALPLRGIGLVKHYPTKVWGMGNKYCIFPAHLMQKIDQWSKLWANYTTFAPRELAKQKFKYNFLHKWAKEITDQEHNFAAQLKLKKLKTLHSFFTSSCLKHYFSFKYGGKTANNLQFITRRKTFLTRWFPHCSKLYNSIGKKRDRNQVSSKRLRVFHAKLNLAMLLHQQQAHVVDGLYSLRLSKLLTKSKPAKLKKQSWQFSSFKPMHIECCYKSASAIFLYPPQKIRWPSSINVKLLQQHLLS